MNILVQVLLLAYVLIMLGEYVRVELLGHMIGVYLVSKKLPGVFPRWLYYFTFSVTMFKNSGCSTSPLTFDVLWVL